MKQTENWRRAARVDGFDSRRGAVNSLDTVCAQMRHRFEVADASKCDESVEGVDGAGESGCGDCCEVCAHAIEGLQRQWKSPGTDVCQIGPPHSQRDSQQEKPRDGEDNLSRVSDGTCARSVRHAIQELLHKISKAHVDQPRAF